MAVENPPYLNAYGNISKALKKIKAAQVPPRFTQDFLATKLGLSGGGARPLIPFLKRTGFLGSDGVPTSRYKRFRNSSETGKAALEALKEGYKAVYEINEYAHEVSDKDLLGIIVQTTGLEPTSSTCKAMVSSFKALKEFAKFTGSDEEDEEQIEESKVENNVSETEGERVVLKKGLGLSYTINLNLPATSDITVFDAIFKSLKEHLLK